MANEIEEPGRYPCLHFGLARPAPTEPGAPDGGQVAELLEALAAHIRLIDGFSLLNIVVKSEPEYVDATVYYSIAEP